MSGDESSASARSAQLVMLAAVAATLVLSDPPAARTRIQGALDEIERWPADARTIRAILAPSCDGGRLDLPDHLKLSWFDEHRAPSADNVPTYVSASCVRLVTPTRCLALTHASTVARAARDVAKRWDCGTLDKAGTLASLNEPDPGQGPARDWAVRTLSDEGALDGALGTTHVAYQDWQSQLTELHARCVAQGQANTKQAALRKQLNLAAPEATSNTSVKDQLDGLEKKASAFAAAFDGFTQASTALRNLPSSSSGTHVVLESPSLRLLLATPAPSPDVPAIAGSLAECLSTTRLTFGPCKQASADPLAHHTVCGGAAAKPLAFSTLTAAGIWADIRDQDVASAESRLEDAKSKTELESEIFGIKLNSQDALRWLWLPITAAEIYGLSFIFWSKNGERDAWWSKLPCQLTLAASAALGIAISVHVGLSRAPDPASILDYPVVLAIAAAITLTIVTIGLLTHTRAEPASANSDLANMGPLDAPPPESRKRAPKDPPGK